MREIFGTDISIWDDVASTPQTVNFEKMKAAGARFVMIKTSQQLYADGDYLENWNNARGVLPRGGYHFLTWDVDPVRQANFVADLLQADPGEIDSFVDFEWWGTVPNAALDFVWAYVNRLDTLMGYKMGIYTAKAFWDQTAATWPLVHPGRPNLSMDPFWSSHPLWLAAWGATNPIVPKPWTAYTLHQYTNTGDGLAYGVEAKAIDLNSFAGDETNFTKFIHGSAPVPAVNPWIEEALTLANYWIGLRGLGKS